MRKLLLILALALPLYGADYETTFEAEADPDVYANFTDSTDWACSGTASAKTTSTSGLINDIKGSLVGVMHWGGYYNRIGLPSGTTRLTDTQNNTAGDRCTFDINSDGSITVGILGGTPANSTAVIASGVPVYLEFKCDTSQSAGNDIAELRVNGSVAVTVSNGSTTGTFTRARLNDGIATSGTAYWDDYYSYDTTLSYRGFSAGCGDVSGGSDNKYKSVVIGD